MHFEGSVFNINHFEKNEKNIVSLVTNLAALPLAKRKAENSQNTVKTGKSKRKLFEIELKATLANP